MADQISFCTCCDAETTWKEDLFKNGEPLCDECKEHESHE